MCVCMCVCMDIWCRAIYSISVLKIGGNSMFLQNEFKTHSSSCLSESNVGEKVRVAGWVETIRDHGGVIFLDLRDCGEILQVVIHDESMLKGVCRESVISVEGTIRKRDEMNYNEKLLTGKIELFCDSLSLLGPCAEVLPFEIDSSRSVKEDLRLKFRFLDLRNKLMHRNIEFRAKVISFMRKKMEEMGFLEIQTPILTASSPEGARDYLIPSRKHKGKFYALPQAPQIFKQLLMVSGFDRYFQVAPCFRDEDSRADRAPGEFYQLDFEMAFATQTDVLNVAQQLIHSTFTEFSKFKVSDLPFPIFTYAESMLKFGTDKPDLRNPLEIIDLSPMFLNSSFAAFSGKCVRSINVLDCAGQPNKFFDKMLNFATSIGMKGLGYLKVCDDLKFKGPIDKFLDENQRAELIKKANLKPGCVLFFVADEYGNAPGFAGQIRTKLAEALGLVEKESFRFCFVNDFPMFEFDDEIGNYIFTHNPFSMPQGGFDALNSRSIKDIVAWQYDLVCNGVELSSGAVRNHDLKTLLKAFEIVGYDEKSVMEKFPALCNAFRFGAPPHAGMAPGIERMLMLLCGEENIREVVAFPMNSSAQDLLLGAPNFVSEQQLREVHLKIR